MKDAMRGRLEILAREPEAYARTVDFLRDKMSAFVRPGERVLLCFPDEGQWDMASLVEKAVLSLDASALRWGPDHSWQSLLRQAFFCRANTLVGPPLVVLGLSKIARETGTPLYVRNVMVAGAPCEEWMIEGIQNGFDARIWGCYDPIPGLVVGGFSCRKSRGVHLRTEELRIEIQAPEGELGQILVGPVSDPSVMYETGEQGRLLLETCPCGDSHPRLLDFRPMKEPDPTLDGLQEYLLSWSSVLDYRAVRTDMGLELEVVAFPGQRLPVLPSCAKRTVRPWIPKHDVPFCVD